MLLGIDSVISPETRTKLSASGYQRALRYMWEAMEKSDIHSLDASKPLHIMLLAGDEEELNKKVKG